MMIEMKERMTCLNSILADREAPFTLEYCQRWKNNCMMEAYQLVNPKKNCSPTIFYGAWYEDDDESVADFLMKLFEENSASLDVSPYVSPEFILANILPGWSTRITCRRSKNRILLIQNIWISLYFFICRWKSMR